MTVAPLNALRRSLFLISAPMVFIMFALPLRAEDLGASAIEIGALYAVFTVSLFVVRPLVGIGLDLIGRRPFFLLALALYFAANFLYALSGNYEALFGARLLQGIAFSILTITTDTITADVSEAADRSRAMGANIASQSRGGMAGAFIGFSLVGAFPAFAWQYSFFIYSIVAVLAVYIAFKIIPETRPVISGDERAEKFRFPPQQYMLLVVIFLAAAAVASIQPYYLIYLRERFDLPLNALAFAFLPVGIAYAVLPGWLGKVTGRLPRAAAMATGLLMTAAIYLFVPHIDRFLMIMAAFTFSAVGAVLAELTRNAWVADIAGPGAAGRTFGVAALVAGAGAALGPLAGGAVYEHVSRDGLFYVAAATLIAAAILLTLQPKRG